MIIRHQKKLFFYQIRDSFGDNEESCLLPLQEKYISTVITPMASSRQEKNTFVSCSESAGSSSCTTPSTATNLKIPNVPVKKVSHHTSPPTTREVAYLDHQGSVQYKTVPSPNQSSDEDAGKLFNLTGSKKKDFSLNYKDILQEMFISTIYFVCHSPTLSIWNNKMGNFKFLS